MAHFPSLQICPVSFEIVRRDRLISHWPSVFFEPGIQPCEFLEEVLEKRETSSKDGDVINFEHGDSLEAEGEKWK